MVKQTIRYEPAINDEFIDSALESLAPFIDVVRGQPVVINSYPMPMPDGPDPSLGYLELNVRTPAAPQNQDVYASIGVWFRYSLTPEQATRTGPQITALMGIASGDLLNSFAPHCEIVANCFDEAWALFVRLYQAIEPSDISLRSGA